MLWSMKVRMSAVCAPKKAALPPNTEALVENVKCAHLQACVWKHALDPEPPNIKPTEYMYGRIKQADNKTLVPVMLHVPSTTTVAPESILKNDPVSMRLEHSCSINLCCCKSARMS